MARQKFKGGTCESKLAIPKNMKSPLPGQVKTQVTKNIRTSGIPTELYQERQSNHSRNSQTWVWDAEGIV